MANGQAGGNGAVDERTAGGRQEKPLSDWAQTRVKFGLPATLPTNRVWNRVLAGGSYTLYI